MVGNILRSKVTWLVTLGAVLMALAMGTSYLGAFLSPEDHIHEFPIGLVNEDEGVSVLGQSQNRGADAIEGITADDPERGDAIEWIVYDSRGDLIEAMHRNEIYGGLVIPADFTRNLASIVRPEMADGEPQAATIELVYNDGGGSLPGAQGREIVQTAAEQIDAEARVQILRTLQSQEQQVPPTMVALVADPVQIRETDEIPAGENTGHGMGSFYIAVVTTVGAFLAADVVSVGVDFVTGHTSMGPRLTRLRGEAIRSTLWEMYKTKLILFLAVALASASVLTWFIVSVTGTPVSNTSAFFGVILLAMVAIGALTLLLITLFSLPGILIGLLVTTILGVPSAFGIFPSEMMPRFYQVLGDVLPVRYLSDAVRSLLFFDGRGDAGLTRGVWVLAIYAVVSIVLGTLASWVMSRRRGDQVEAA